MDGRRRALAIPIGEVMYDFLALAFVGVAAFVLGVRVGIGAAQGEKIEVNSTPWN